MDSGPLPRETERSGSAFLDISGLTKTFGAHRALDGASLHVRAGEIHALLGQNGSGKSTLIKVLAGIHQPDAGSLIEVDGAPLEIGARHGHDAGFRFVHQDLGLIGQLSAAENLELTAERPRAWFSDRALRHRAEAVCAQHGVDLDVTTPVQDLTRAQQSLVAIVRAIADLPEGKGLLVLDEPTASLPPTEVSHLLDVIRAIARSGISVLYVTHRMEEVFAAAHRLTVLRNGRTVLATDTADITPDQLTDAITGPGRAAAAGGPAAPSALAEAATPALRVSGLTGRRVRHVDLVARSGEILGITGLVGSGYEETLAYIFAASRRDGGEVTVHGTRLSGRGCAAAVRAGVGYVPSDRDRLGSIPQWTIAENLTLPAIPRRALGLLSRRRERAESTEWSERLEIVPADVDRTLMELSGGNRQRVAVGRWLRHGCRVLLLDEPTIGVDVGGMSRIYRMLREAAEDGVAVVVASSDHPELLEICDRILVLRDGALVASFERGRVTQEELFRASVAPAGHGTRETDEEDHE